MSTSSWFDDCYTFFVTPVSVMLWDTCSCEIYTTEHLNLANTFEKLFRKTSDMISITRVLFSQVFKISKKSCGSLDLEDAMMQLFDSNHRGFFLHLWLSWSSMYLHQYPTTRNPSVMLRQNAKQIPHKCLRGYSWPRLLQSAQLQKCHLF